MAGKPTHHESRKSVNIPFPLSLPTPPETMVESEIQTFFFGTIYIGGVFLLGFEIHHEDFLEYTPAYWLNSMP